MNSFKLVLLSLLLFIRISGFSQTLVNGNFLLGGFNWGCNPETGSEIFYIGNLNLNVLAEVDATAGLCQTVGSLIPGNSYYISVDASRRTGGCPSPSVTNMDLTVVGALSVTVTRTNTVFGWSTSAYLFTATSSTHNIILTAGSGFGGSTCGMMVDNILVVASVLPVELIQFSGEIKNNETHLSWSTATEKNSNYFEIQKSEDGINFKPIQRISSKAKNGKSSALLEYETTDTELLDGISYYRFRQVDFDESSGFSPIVAVDYQKEQPDVQIYPNPGNGVFNIAFPNLKNKQDVELQIYNQLGDLRYSSVFSMTSNSVSNINPDVPLEPGCYNFCILVNGTKIYKKVLVQ